MKTDVNRARRIVFIYVSIFACFVADVYLAISGIDTMVARAVVDSFGTYMVVAALAYIGVSVTERAKLVEALATKMGARPEQTPIQEEGNASAAVPPK